MAKLRVLGENPPPPRGNGENQLRELRDYLTRMKDELEFLLTHLGEDNLDGGLTEYLRRIREQSGQISGIQEKITDIEGEISDIDTALSGKQDTLTFDDAPTASSSNPVKSGGVYSALATEIMIVDFGTISSLPVTKSNAAIKADYVVLAYELGTPGAQTGDWTITTSAGSVSVSGTIVGSTTLKLVLGLPGTSIS